jgi:hypothetical protein
MPAAQVAGLAAQATALEALYHAFDRSSAALLVLQSLHQQLEAAKPAAKGAVTEALERYDRECQQLIEGEKGEGAAPGLATVQGRLEGLYGIVLRGDAPATEAQGRAMEALLRQAPPLVERQEKLVAALAPLNRTLKEAGFAPLNPSLAPARDKKSADEE